MQACSQAERCIGTLPRSTKPVTSVWQSSDMARQEDVTEALKAADQMEWVRRMNSIRNRAEEIVLTELVYE